MRQKLGAARRVGSDACKAIILAAARDADFIGEVVDPFRYALQNTDTAPRAERTAYRAFKWGPVLSANV